MLTKHFKLEKDFVPVYTGGTFRLLKDRVHALALNEDKITLFNTATGDLIGNLAIENEEILQFAVSPNFELLAASNKTGLLRVF